MKRYLILLILLSFLLTGCITVLPGQTEASTTLKDTASDPPTETKIPVGWFSEAEQTFYINEDGSRHTGWLELGDTRYYLNENGVLQTGWLELDGQNYYLKENGSISRGKVTIDNRTYHFTA